MEKRKEKKQNIVPGGIIDYVFWRGDLSFEVSPWTEVDGVIAAVISYANFGENELVFGSGRTLRLSSLAEGDLLARLPQEGLGDSAEIRDQFLMDLAKSERFRNIVILDQVNDVDTGRDIQFSAMTMDVPGVGTVIAFRGTDPTLVGWKEDFMMSYMTPVPSQSAAIGYLAKAAAQTAGPMILAGHSKGGNLALYAAAHTAPEIQDRLRIIYSFDGPGLDDETITSEGYRRIEPVIHSVVPRGSIVGLLMNYHPVYRIVKSKSFSIFQHDLFNWQLVGRNFLEEKSVSEGARIMDRTVHEWLNSCTREQREIFVTYVFSLLEKKGKESGQADEQLKKADDSTRKMIQSMINRLLSIHAGNSWDISIRRPLLRAAEEMRLKLKGRDSDFIQSDVITIDNHGNGFDEAAAQAEKAAQEGGLNHKDALRLMLLTEEMLSMASIVTGEMTASFWVEHELRSYELHLATRTDMNRQKKKKLKSSFRGGKSGKAGSFLEKLRGAFEHAMASEDDDVCFDLAAGLDRMNNEPWEGFEQSVLLHLADGVRIAIHGSEVRMTVRKDFTPKPDMQEGSKPK